MLPKEIFITNEHVEDEGGWYAASVSAVDAVTGSEEESPLVGKYKLIKEETLELVKTVKVRKTKVVSKEKQ